MDPRDPFRESCARVQRPWCATRRSCDKYGPTEMQRPVVDDHAVAEETSSVVTGGRTVDVDADPSPHAKTDLKVRS
jgi:hypothetical protein